MTYVHSRVTDPRGKIKATSIVRTDAKALTLDKFLLQSKDVSE